ncbi:MAG: hypothetical protein JWN78_2663 [Bacteroidota bacterium]|nr:hypothetical protein [Bacteroidota bacterium]
MKTYLSIKKTNLDYCHSEPRLFQLSLYAEYASRNLALVNGG